MTPMERRVRWACIFALVALALMAFSLVYPTPLPLIVAMSVGQVVGTASLALYIVVIVADLLRSRVLARGDSVQPAPKEDPR